MDNLANSSVRRAVNRPPFRCYMNRSWFEHGTRYKLRVQYEYKALVHGTSTRFHTGPGTTSTMRACYAAIIRMYAAAVTSYYEALRSASGFRRPLCSLTKNGTNADEAGREVYGFRCKPTTCKLPELHARG